MSTTFPLLMNAKSGSLYRSRMKAWLRRHQESFEVIPTHSAEEALERARELVAAGAPIVVAAGGDGTLMNIAQALIGTKTALGILPCGTMNVFARELGIGSHRYSRALKVLQAGHMAEVDIFAVNGRPFLQMAGIGADAEIIRRITPTLKRRLGPAAHIVTGFQLLREELPEVTLTADNGEVYTGAQIILGNGRRYGGSAKLFSDARYDDGLLDGITVQRKKIGILLEILSYILVNGASEANAREHVDVCQFSGGIITANKDVAYELDGDFAGILKAGDSLRVEQLPRKLTVCLPL